MKNIESRFPLKSQTAVAAVSVARFRSSSGTPDRPWMKQLRDLAKSSFSREGSSGTPQTDPSCSRPKWSGFWSGKRSGSSSQATSMDSKSKPKGMYKDFEALFGSK
ncbi:unnamed protein product [Lactuca virosa]|uniref:Uncharacterized protein n=1 Tax=Lactuca virosa TaxID=75947 RepID=A0AAU9MCP9_9ASTR|nr:unnamed protein product [Lactuca virosa]